MSRAPREVAPITRRIEPAAPAPVLAHYTLQAIAAKIEAWRETSAPYSHAYVVLEDIDKLIRSAT